MAWASGIKHAVTDKAAMQRLMAGTATGDERDFVIGFIYPHQIIGFEMQVYQVMVRGGKAAEAFNQDVVYLVDEFFHKTILIQNLV
jgi:hypothetical protein